MQNGVTHTILIPIYPSPDFIYTSSRTISKRFENESGSKMSKKSTDLLDIYSL